ncbi:hypothetical protein Nepgr_033856 [Nepenthes gracilis]|uniref:Uncharacterized protein n=1 Tax=Nepenthes gracilis TaxID=150966 RepID=A0AAD3TN38_NEPGR|nr:hypothetical protein Nepgr_033856 [Nepenthes gracilis]
MSRPQLKILHFPPVQEIGKQPTPARSRMVTSGQQQQQMATPTSASSSGNQQPLWVAISTDFTSKQPKHLSFQRPIMLYRVGCHTPDSNTASRISTSLT